MKYTYPIGISSTFNLTRSCATDLTPTKKFMPEGIAPVESFHDKITPPCQFQIIVHIDILRPSSAENQFLFDRVGGGRGEGKRARWMAIAVDRSRERGWTLHIQHVSTCNLG